MKISKGKSASLKCAITLKGNTYTILWPIRMDKNKLSRKIMKNLDKEINKEVKNIRQHFKEGAWNLDLRCIEDDILREAFGFNINDYILSRLLKSTEGLACTQQQIVSDVDRVFYNIKTNKIYIDKQVKDINNDIQLSLL